LARNAATVSWRSAITAERHNSGTEMASRKNCSEIKLSAGDSDENGPFPRSALQMDTKATSSRDPDVRPGPNRTAAHRRNGRGTYTSVGMLRTPGGPLNTKTAVTASSAS